MVHAVVFDVGETLMQDRRHWGSWAEWLGVPSHTLSALVGAVTALGRDNVEALRLIRPGFDLESERRAREAAGHGETIAEEDLYPDVRPTLAALREAGLWVGIAGNQTERAATLLRELNLPVDAVATSGQWGVAKPDPRFFSRMVTWVGLAPAQIAYVGDHRDHDIVAARAAGLQAAHVRRGPWGYLWANDPLTVRAATWRVNSLTALVSLLPAP
ncbi:MAG: HAD-IA family hydrolase [Dactylosporangium sp.]|nr:HAD family hydrolase [Dactylosporangium sp.]NNJ61914.1 HAD-IA family hydrolase [Dactylosporangium sp.]